MSVHMNIYVQFHSFYNSVFLPVKTLAEETKAPTTKIGWGTLHSGLHCVGESGLQQPICPIGRAVWGVGQRPLACWDRGFESHRGHGCLSVVSVVCCQVGVSATSRTLVQRSPTDCARRCVWYKNLIYKEPNINA
jgi:hypothetical protein